MAQKIINLQDIDPSPYQRRRYFDQDKLKELAASIQREGLIEPIVVRRKSGRYELIAGERRLLAIRDYTELETIQAQVVHVDDLQARRISAAENMQREDLSAIEIIEAIVEIVDAEMIEDKQYATMGKTPGGRVKSLLGGLHSARSSKIRGSEVSKEAGLLLSKFTQQVEQIFRNLPKPLEWLSFYLNDFPLLMNFCEEVQDASVKHHLNKSQTRSLAKLKEASEEEFQRMITPVCRVEHSTGRQEQRHPLSEAELFNHSFHKIHLRDFSAR